MFFLLSVWVADISLLERWTVVFWYTTLGGVVGISNVVVREPVTNLPLPWWLRAPLISAWLCLMVVLFAGDRVQKLVCVVHVSNGVLTSPYWFVVDGMIVGIVAGVISTRTASLWSARQSDST